MRCSYANQHIIYHICAIPQPLQLCISYTLCVCVCVCDIEAIVYHFFFACYIIFNIVYNNL